MFWGHASGIRQCNVFFGFFLKGVSLLIVFGRFGWSQEGPTVGRCSESTAAGFAQMTAGVTGLDDEEALASGWLEERQCVDAGHLVKMDEVYPSAGSS